MSEHHIKHGGQPFFWIGIAIALLIVLAVFIPPRHQAAQPPPLPQATLPIPSPAEKPVIAAPAEVIASPDDVKYAGEPAIVVAPSDQGEKIIVPAPRHVRHHVRHRRAHRQHRIAALRSDPWDWSQDPSRYAYWLYWWR